MSSEEADPESLARVGQVIGGKYQLLRLLGAGGMGAVYEAENTWIKRRVAIKVLHKDLAQNKEVLRRFTQEAQSSTQIEHPNIVYVLDMGQEPSDGSFFIVQEFLTGSDLRKTLDEVKRVPVRQALEIVAPVLSAMAAAHDRGIIHRDLKPENIFLLRGPNGETVPKVIDFGISKVLNDNGASLTKTRTGISVGTPYYMSPEQARGDTNIDAAADVWSLGVMLYEMVAGTMPFDAPNYNLLIIKIVTERPRRLEEVAPDVPADFAALVHRAIEPDRAQRIPNARAFLNAVVQYAAACADPFGFSLPSGFTGPVSTTTGNVPTALHPGVSGAIAAAAVHAAAGSQPGINPATGSNPGAPVPTLGARPAAVVPPGAGSSPGMMAPGMAGSQPGMVAPGGMGSQPGMMAPAGMMGSQPGMMAPGGMGSQPGMIPPAQGGYMQGTAPTMLGGMGPNPAFTMSQAGPTPLGWAGPPPAQNKGGRVALGVFAGVLVLGVAGGAAFWFGTGRGNASTPPAAVTVPAPIALTPPPTNANANMPAPFVPMPPGAVAMADPTPAAPAPEAPAEPRERSGANARTRGDDDAQQAPRPGRDNSHRATTSNNSASAAPSPAANNPPPPANNLPPPAQTSNTPVAPPPAVTPVAPPPAVYPPPPPAVSGTSHGGAGRVAPAPNYPVYGQANALATRAMSAANQVASSDPRRANRIQNLAARLQSEVNEARQSDMQANAMDAANPGSGERMRNRAARIREGLQRRMERLQEEMP